MTQPVTACHKGCSCTQLQHYRRSNCSYKMLKRALCCCHCAAPACLPPLPPTAAAVAAATVAVVPPSLLPTAAGAHQVHAHGCPQTPKLQHQLSGRQQPSPPHATSVAAASQGTSVSTTPAAIAATAATTGPFTTTCRAHASTFIPASAAAGAVQVLPVLVPPPRVQRVLLLLLLLLLLFQPLATTQPSACATAAATAPAEGVPGSFQAEKHCNTTSWEAALASAQMSLLITPWTLAGGHPVCYKLLVRTSSRCVRACAALPLAPRLGPALMSILTALLVESRCTAHSLVLC
jgi:hypothetical protein